MRALRIGLLNIHTLANIKENQDNAFMNKTRSYLLIEIPNL